LDKEQTYDDPPCLLAVQLFHMCHHRIYTVSLSGMLIS